MTHAVYPEYKDSGVEWLGDVPAHWGIGRLKHLLRIQGGQDYKAVESVEPTSYPVIGSGGQFTYATDYLYDGESVLLGRKGTIDKPLYVKGKFWTVDTMFYTEVLPRANGRYAYYASTIIPFSLYSTNTALPSMSQFDLANHIQLLPGYKEQAEIATFLDHETARIDTLIAEQQRLIALLKEKRQVVISHAVTKGLDPDASMKDSGVEWLGAVPAHWEVKSLMHLTPPDRKIMYGIVLPGPDFDGGVPIIKGGDVKPGRLSLKKLCRTDPKIEAKYERSRVNSGDIVYSIRGGIGDAEVVPEEISESNLTQDAARISPKSGVCNNWLLYALKSGHVFSQMEAKATGATIRGINIMDLKRAAIPVPPSQEQQKIAERLDFNIGKLVKLEKEASAAITLMQERRSALISAVVTGKIDVRGWQAAEQAEPEDAPIAAEPRAIYQ